MQYEDAVKIWGATKLRQSYPRVKADKIDPKNVSVEMEFNEGYACCGGSDPLCYCSFAESPSANVLITCGIYRVEISHYEFDFVSVLGEIVAAGDGTITE